MSAVPYYCLKDLEPNDLESLRKGKFLIIVVTQYSFASSTVGFLPM